MTCGLAACGSAPDARRGADLETVSAKPACEPGEGAVVLASLPHFGSPSVLGLDSTYVYWSHDGVVLRVPKAGGAIEDFAKSWGAENVKTLVSDDEYVYFNGLDSRMTKIPRRGGPPTVLTSGELGPVAIDATDIYIAEEGAGTIGRLPKSGGNWRAVVSVDAPGHGRTEILTLQGDYVYWASSSPPFVQRVPKAGGHVESLPIDGYAFSIASDASHLYAAIGSYNGGPGGGIVATALDGSGKPRSLAPVEASGPIAIDATHVYIAGVTNVWTVAKTGGPVTPLVPNERAFAIATDGECVYWARSASGSDGSPGAIVRAPRAPDLPPLSRRQCPEAKRPTTSTRSAEPDLELR